MSVLSLAKKALQRFQETPREFKYPGVRAALDGNTAVVFCERESTDGAGAYPITPSTQMGEGWAEAAASGHLNISGRPLIFIEPEGEHAAAAVTAGLAMTGLRAANFSSGQGIAYMHESLYAAVGKRLTYVLNVGARAMTKSTLNVHAGHDDYHSVDDTGFFQLFAKNVQAAADLNLIAHRIAELALNPGIVAQDGFLTTHLIESMLLPERDLIAEYLGRPDDLIETPTPAQRILYGETRRRIPMLWDVDNPVMAGLVQNQDAYMQSVASQRPFFFDHLKELTERAMNEFFELTGRRYARVGGHRTEDADYLIIGQGSVVPSAEAVADYLRETRGLAVGVVDLTMFRPFPGDLVGELLKGRKGVAVLERTDQPLASDLPLVREIRATVAKCLENGRELAGGRRPVHPELAVYERLADLPSIYSGSFGLGSRDLQPEGLIAAIENMLPQGKRKKLFYLSIDFVREKALTPKQEGYQQTIEEAYPGIRDLALKGSENPNLMPPGAVTVRFHSVGGWGAMTTGKNLAMTLFELLGYQVKANPKYGSEKKGQPTTYYLSVAPEPIRVNCEYHYVDVVLSPDPNVFHHTNALAGLRDNGVFILQSDATTPEEVWQSIPSLFQKTIVERKIQLFAFDAFRIAREEASDPELQLRMQGIAFQGAFFAASDLIRRTGLDEAKLIAAIRAQLESKFGAKGARVVEDNVRVVRRGFDEVKAIPHGPISEPKAGARVAGAEPPIPVMVQALPQSAAPTTDIHRFWEQTGNFYARGLGNENLADPFIGLGIMPASSALFRDMTAIRFEHPEWIGENCTACGKCYTVCPDTAIPGLVSEVSAVFDTVVKRVRKEGHAIELLPRAVRQLERHLRKEFDTAGEKAKVGELLASAIDTTIAKSDLADGERQKLVAEFALFQVALGGFQFALSRPYYTLPEQKQAGDGGLLSITINPYTCKGCMECVEVCDDDALRPAVQTSASVDRLRRQWDLWLDLPTTPKRYQRIDDLEQGIGALETLLLDKAAYSGFTSGDGACLGCSEKTILHLFTGTVEALMLPRVAKQVAKLDDLIARLEAHVQKRLVGDLDLSDPAAMERIVRESRSKDLTLAGIAGQLEARSGGSPIDPEWLERTTKLLGRLRDLRWRYTEGTNGRGRSRMGIVNSTGCTSVWGSTYPYNPYPFPWTNHLFQDSPSMAMGIFEGQMAKMADGFRAVRRAELELGDRTASASNGINDDEALTYFDWQQFTDEEWELCPPVVAVGGDGAMYDIGFQNLSRLMASGKPIKVLVVDTQVYSNTGGQACTSGFIGQISDMAQYGKVWKGKPEPRKEIGLIAMAHRTTFVLQGTIAHPGQMIEGFISGLKARRPALFNLYSSCQPEHGIGDDMASHQAKLAVESRAYPLFKYDPAAGRTPADCFDLSGNPELDADWPTYTLKYKADGREKEMALPLTFADFALTEARFRKQFRLAPPDTWSDAMVPMHEFLELPEEEREGKFPYVWSVDKKGRLQRLIAAQTMVASCEDRRDFWTMLRSLAGVDRKEVDREQIAAQARAEVAAQLQANLYKIATGGAAAELFAGIAAPSPRASTSAPRAASVPASPQLAAQSKPAAGADDAMTPWIDTELCTSCDECTRLNPKLFAYNADKQATIRDPSGGPYSDLVKAAEKCTARVIHPGLPRDRSFKDAAKWIERGKKYN